MIIPFLVLGIVATANAYLRVCYYSNWAQYRRGEGRFLPENIDPHLCTHIIFSFAKLMNNQLAIIEYNDEEIFDRINQLKIKNKNLKTLLALGGWNAGSLPFSNLAASSSLRKNFAKTSAQFLRDRGFDGLDMDWEYPAARGGAAADKINFVLWLKDLREEFEREKDQSGLPRLLLTAAVAAGKGYVDSGYDVPGMNMYLDFINLMAYDLHGAWESVTGHNAPLYSRSSEQGAQAYLNVDWAAKYWVQKGTPPNKLIIGLATYGRSFRLANENNNGMGAPATGSGGDAGPYVSTVGFMAYYEVCLKLSRNEGTRKWDNEHKVPYLVDGNQWIGYDDEESITLKLRYIKANGYGGAMVWNLDLDDFQRICPLSTRNFTLMSLMKEVLDGNQPTPSPTTNGPTNPPTSRVTNPPTSKRTNSPTDEHTNPTTNGPTTDGPETMPPNTEFCSNRDNGLYPDPQDCNKYYNCWAGQTHQVSCAPGLVFNPNYNYCDYKYNYDCEVASTQNPVTTAEKSTPAPTTQQPTTKQVTTQAATTQQPTTKQVTTQAATTQQPTTKQVTTQAATTQQPTTKQATTQAATTQRPTTKVQTTNQPTTQSATTMNPGDQDFCDDKDNGLHKMVEDCSKYYHCVEGDTYIFSCEPGTLFSASMKNCEWAENVDCSDIGPTTNYCFDKLDGLYWYPYNCAKYYQCGSKITYIQSCAPGTVFDSDVSNCGWRGQVDCKGAPDK